ncbi:MAG: PAS-domain containing protein, partial [Armatimonadetes bacterium]|nr:PAS-domain containing protein [Armatimonadota bacterium]
FDAQGRLREANQVARRLLGLAADDDALAAARDGWFCSGDLQPLPDHLNPIHHVSSSGLAIRDAQLLWRRPSGQPVTLVMDLAPVPGARPGDAFEVQAVISNQVDTAELSSQISKLMSDTAHHRHLLNLVFDNVDSGIALMEQDDRLALWNRPFERIWGYRPAAGEAPATTDELLARVPWDFTAVQRASFEAAVAGARESFEPVSFEVDSVSTYLHVYTCRLAGGRRLWALRDLTEPRRLSRELEAATEQVKADRNLLQLVFANVEAGLMVCDQEGRVLACNPVFSRMWDLAPGWTDGHPRLTEMEGWFRRYFTPDTAHDYEVRLARLAAQNAAGVIEMRTADGRVLGLYTAPLGNGGRLYSFRDFTAQRRLEESLAVRNEELARALDEQERMLEQLAEADRLKSEFLANTSHELRTPLNSILGYLGLIIDGLYQDEQELTQFARTAHRSADHLLAVINDLLDIARIESGRMEVHPEPVPVCLAIEEIIATVRPQLAAKNLGLLVPEPDLELLAMADPARLRQVLLNVIGNAVKFTSVGGIDITHGVDADQVWIQVRDSGIGIAASKQAAIFDKFVQADGSMARAYGGAGLGLAITHSLLELMGGRITVTSDGPGEGTLVRIELPRA